MKVKIFSAPHYEEDIERMENEINTFLAEGDGDILESYFTINNSTLYYFVEYED